MPKAKKIHLAITLRHNRQLFTRTLCDNGGAEARAVHDFADVTDEERGSYGENLCYSCLNRIPYAPLYVPPTPTPEESN